ncbi:MAG: replication-associated recombination protein A, partial [Planctomycetaceae bacterium]|nr:replication-associated recombination protein A [Planctomycetaceae bacterium]
MSYIALARKYRPSGFEEVIGQEAIGLTLKNALKLDRVHHAYLFHGPRGVGKTSMARILAK